MLSLLRIPWISRGWTSARKQQLEPDMEQQTASKLGKEYTPRLTRVQPQLDPGIP